LVQKGKTKFKFILFRIFQYSISFWFWSKKG
jgi:hypothetical protein